MIQFLSDAIQSLVTGRSPKWGAVRRKHLLDNPLCVACGGDKDLQVHHIKPFHLYPPLELDPENLITLCEASGRECHFRFGHGFNWKWYCVGVVEAAQAERARLFSSIRKGA